MNVATLLDHSAELYGPREAVHFEDESITYERLASRAASFAGGLRNLGLGPDDRVALHLPNSLEFVIAIWGTFQAGAIPTPMNPQLRKREIEHQLRDSGARIVITSPPDQGQVLLAASGVGGVEVFLTGDAGEQRSFNEIDGNPVREVRDDGDIALQPYTSGTTGKPKGVLLTHGNLTSNVRALLDMIPLAPEDYRALAPLPMFHITGMTATMLAPIAGGGTVHPLRSWDAAETLAAIERHQITCAVCVPTLFIDMLKVAEDRPYDLSSLTHCFSGGAGLPISVLEEFESRFGIKIYEGYGLSETSPVTHINLAAPERRAGSVGWPIDGCEAKVVDSEGRTVPDGEVGEMCVRGPMVMQGYHNNREATAEVLDDEGWFRTGDLTRRDADGYFYIVDRKKEMILTGGLNVYPKEVENVLHEHDAVVEAAVVGIPHPRKGETVKAFVVLADGEEANREMEDEIRNHCIRELAVYKHPRQIEFIDELPRTGSGKVKKFELRGR